MADLVVITVVLDSSLISQSNLAPDSQVQYAQRGEIDTVACSSLCSPCMNSSLVSVVLHSSDRGHNEVRGSIGNVFDKNIESCNPHLRGSLLHFLRLFTFLLAPSSHLTTPLSIHLMVPICVITSFRCSSKTPTESVALCELCRRTI